MELWQLALLCLAIGVLITLGVKKSISLTLGVKDFNYNHPELEEGEIFLTNQWDDNCYIHSRGEISWSTKRYGEQAYDIHGDPLRDGYPVFVQKSELEKAGLDLKKVTPKWVNIHKIP